MTNKALLEYKYEPKILPLPQLKKWHFIVAYIGLYFFISLLCSTTAWIITWETSVYPYPSECLIVPKSIYYFNSTISGQGCLLDFEGFLFVQLFYLIISLLAFYPLIKLRFKIWEGRRFAALPEWILLTLFYYYFVVSSSNRAYDNCQEYFETLRAVLMIFFPFLMWQWIVTIGYWILRLIRYAVKK